MSHLQRSFLLRRDVARLNLTFGALPNPTSRTEQSAITPDLRQRVLTQLVTVRSFRKPQ